ncbi:Gx transporter family protein [Halonatronum saccharophilum]|uniref:Gx transporter family protein n=1 Tax=Halonatronum saccharophilum TaxID=150060 RepID=UPI0004AD0D3B|nr:Gx transporter family protein [Halonatronum saccharophilum]
MKKTRGLMILSLLVAGAIVLHIVEFMLPTTLLFPGAKLGLANIITLFTLINFGFKSGLQVLILRILISSLLIGTFLTTGFFLSLTGGLLSFLVMSYFYYNHKCFSIIGISVLGAAFHNLGQVLMAFILIESWMIIFYLPYLLMLSLPTGIFIGVVVIKLEKYLQFDGGNKKEFVRN